MFQVVRESRESVALQELVGLLDADLNERHGLLQSFYDQFNSLANVEAAVVAWDGDRAVGCGCFKRFDERTVEIKRMFVRPECRGTSAAKQLLDELEKWAVEAGCSRAVLETGLKNPEAIRFYTKCGYTTIENYGQYAGVESSICMEKVLSGHLAKSPS